MALCSRLHGSLLDRSRPLWEMHLIEGLSDGRFAVYTKIHHAVAHGVTAMKMLRNALSENSDDRDVPAPWQPRGPRPQRTPSKGFSLSGLAGSTIRTARETVGEVAGLVPALAGTVSRAFRDQGGPLALSAP